MAKTEKEIQKNEQIFIFQFAHTISEIIHTTKKLAKQKQSIYTNVKAIHID